MQYLCHDVKHSEFSSFFIWENGAKNSNKNVVHAIEENAQFIFYLFNELNLRATIIHYFDEIQSSVKLFYTKELVFVLISSNCWCIHCFHYLELNTYHSFKDIFLKLYVFMKTI